LQWPLRSLQSLRCGWRAYMSVTQTLPRPTPAYLQNSEWIFDHIDELTHQYPNQWVGAYGGRVLAAGHGLGEVVQTAERLAPGHDIAYHFVDDGTLIYAAA